jgi:carbon-monoxide dehydrogenase large subunit
VLPQVVADELDVEPAQVSAERLDTAIVSEGIGTYASRSTITAGNAAHQAAARLLAEARPAAARALGVAEDALVVRDGGFEVIDDPAARIALADIAAETDAGLTAGAVYRVERPAYSHGAVAAVVQVDPELGRVQVERLVIGYDVGRAINPRLVEGQLVGAARSKRSAELCWNI